MHDGSLGKLQVRRDFKLASSVAVEISPVPVVPACRRNEIDARLVMHYEDLGKNETTGKEAQEKPDHVSEVVPSSVARYNFRLTNFDAIQGSVVPDFQAASR